MELSRNDNVMESKVAEEKRRYAPPRLRIVELTVKEVLASGCKTSSGGYNFGNPDCTNEACSTIGSS